MPDMRPGLGSLKTPRRRLCWTSMDYREAHRQSDRQSECGPGMATRQPSTTASSRPRRACPCGAVTEGQKERSSAPLPFSRPRRRPTGGAEGGKTARCASGWQLLAVNRRSAGATPAAAFHIADVLPRCSHASWDWHTLGRNSPPALVAEFARTRGVRDRDEPESRSFGIRDTRRPRFPLRSGKRVTSNTL